MDTSKWSQILGCFFALIGFVLWLTEAKWADAKASRIKKRIIMFAAIVWGLAMAVLVIVTYKSISQHEKAPRFVFFLNGLPLTNDACITIPTTNDTLTLDYSVFNGGSAEAEGLQLFTAYPSALNVVASGTWHEEKLVKEDISNGLNVVSDRAFRNPPNTSLLLPTNTLQTFTPPLTLPLSNLHNSVNSLLLLRAIAKHDVMSELHYTLHITNGVGRPYIGF